MRGATPPEEASEATASKGTPREVNPDYVRDLLSRLKETMEVINESEDNAGAAAPASSARTDDRRAADDDVPPWETPQSAWGERPATPTAVPATPAPRRTTNAAAVDRVRSTEMVEELTFDGMIDEMLAERRDRTEPEATATRADRVTEDLFTQIGFTFAGEETTAAEETALTEEIPAAEEALVTEEASAVEEAPVTEEAFATQEVVAVEDSSVTEEAAATEDAPAVEETLVAEEAPAVEETSATEEASAAEEAPAVEGASLTEDGFVVEEAAIAEPPPAAPAPAAALWELTAAAATEHLAAKKRKGRRFRATFLFKEDPPAREEPTVREVGEATPLFATEEAPVAEYSTEEAVDDTVGTLRPQDFFIADLRHEEELTEDAAEEYVSRNQIETILGRYAAEKRQYGIRFAISLAITLFIFVFENLPLLGVSVCDLVGIPPRMYSLLDIGLLAVSALLALDVLREGARELFAWQFGMAAITTATASVTLLLLVVNLALGISETAPLCALPAAMAMTMALGISHLRIRDAEKTFLHLCESGDKLAAEILPPAYATEESAALGRRVRNVLRVKKVGFVAGYFSRMKQRREDYRLHTVLTVATVAALVLGTVIYAIFAPEKTGTAILSFAVRLASPLALSVFFASGALAFHHLVEVADAHGTAVLGEASAEEYAGVDTVAFEDVEAYPSRNVRVRRIKMYDNSRLDELLYYMASIFSVVGGPLDGIFRVSASELGISEAVSLVSTGEEGLEADVDSNRIRIGKWGYFKASEVEPYYDTEDVYKEDAGNISILYVSVNGTVAAKLYIEYNLSRRFEKTVRRLHRNGVTALVRSFDPGIGDTLLATTVHYPGLRIKTVRKKTSQICDFAEARVECGLVTGAGSRDLLYSFFLCLNYRKVTRLFRILKAVAVPVTLAAAILLPLSGLLPTFYSVYAAGLSLFWLLPVYLISRFYFKKER